VELQRAEHNNTEIHFLKGVAGEPLIHCMIEGVTTERGREVINSIVASAKKELLNKWKHSVANEINKEIPGSVSVKHAAVSVSLSFFFSVPLRGKRSFDVENFIKPVLDGIAKGLFARDWDKERGQAKIKFNEDDSVFRQVYFERHDIKDSCEGVFVTVWEADR
jgi:hypothetical protein